jgi:uncharacterized membrane protein
MFLPTTMKVLMALASIAVALVSYRFLLLGLDQAFAYLHMHLDARKTVFTLHVTFGPLALAIGALQFFHSIRRRQPAIHRWLGRTYAFSILIAGLAGLGLAFGSLDRPVAATGFGLLSVIWLYTTFRGVQAARHGRFDEHRKWMIRSFALTFAAVTLRLQLPVLMGAFGMDYLEASHIVGWSCWVPNLLIAEWILLRRPDSPDQETTITRA